MKIAYGCQCVSMELRLAAELILEEKEYEHKDNMLMNEILMKP